MHPTESFPAWTASAFEMLKVPLMALAENKTVSLSLVYHTIKQIIALIIIIIANTFYCCQH